MKTFLIVMIGIMLSSASFAQLSGVKTIDPNGSGPNNYFSMAQAVLDLNAVGVGTGGVTFNIAAGTVLNETADISITTTTSDASKPIIFQKTGSGANPIVRAKTGTVAVTTFGNTGDYVVKIVSTDYVTFDGLDFRSNTSATTNTTLAEYGIFLTKTATDACKNITVKNCNFSLTKTNGTYSIGIYQSNLPSTTSTGVTVTSIGGRAENNTYMNNTFDNTYHGIYVNGFSHTTSPYLFLDNNNRVIGNTISNWAGGSVVAYGIYTVNQDSVLVRDNTVTGGSGNTTTLYALYNAGGTNTMVTYAKNSVSLTNVGTSSYYGIYMTGSSSGTTSVGRVDSNVVFNSSSSSTGILYSIYSSGFASKNVYFRNNTVYGNRVNGTFYGIYASTSSTTILDVSNNLITDNGRTASTALSGTYYNLYMGSYGTGNIYNNRVSNVKFLPLNTGSIYGFYDLAGPAVSNVYNNTIDSITALGANSIYPFYSSTSTTTNKFIYNNTIQRIYSQGGSTMYGMYLAGSDTASIYKNKISQLKADSARVLTLTGMYVASGTNMRIYNNFISELSTLNGYNSSAATAAIRGVWITSTDCSFFNNSLYLNASSTTTNALGFGVDGIFVSTTPTTLDLRNNIVVNKSTVVAPGKIVGLRRSATSTSSISSFMNNNIYYTAAAPTSLTPVYTDGTNVDSTIELMKSRLAPAESNSVFEDVPFVNTTVTPYDLHINPNLQTRVESGGTPVSFITDDIDGNARNANYPDAGADEGTFTVVPGDFIPPTISSVTINPSTQGLCNSVARTITATVTDNVGVGSVVILWKKDGVSQPNITMTAGANNTYTGSIPAAYSTKSSISVSWNLIAYDSAPTPNSKAYTGTTYKDAALYIDAGYTGKDTVNAGSTIQFNAKATPALVTMGSNNSTSNITTPFYRVWGANKRQYLYRASELSAAGLPVGGITGINFDVVSTGTATVIPSMNIYIDSTQVTTTSATYLPSNNLAYTNTTGYTATTGINSFAFNTPFVWNGTSNIYITVCWADGTAGGTTTFYVKASTTTYTSSTYTNTDNTTTSAQCALTSGTSTSARPDISFLYNPPRTYTWTTSPNTSVSNTSILNPTSTLTAAGNYQYIVSVNDGTCTNTDTVKIVAVIPQKPVVNFTASATTANIGGNPTTVTFTDQSTNVPDSYQWTFTPNTVTYMSGTNSTSINPQVRFTGKGPYTVKLRAANLGGADSLTKTAYINTVLTYCASASTNTADEDVSNVSITDLSTGAILLNNGVDSPFLSRPDNNKFYTNWYDSTNVDVPVLMKGGKYRINVSTSYTTTNTYSHSKTVYIDYNDNGSFDDPGEMINLGSTLSPITATTFRKNVIFTVPCTADTGVHRMRVQLYETTTNPLSSCGTPSSWGETEDYKIRIMPTQLLYDSSVAVQNVLTDVQPNTTNNQVLMVKLVANGCDGTLSATNFNIGTSGTTNLADVTNAKLWYTAASPTFATTTQFGTNLTAASTLNFTGNQSLLADTNYFWLTYDLAANAGLGNTIDAAVNSITVNGTAQVPSITSPTGNRLINFPASVSNVSLEQKTGAIERNTNDQVILRDRLIMSSTGAAVPVTQIKVALTGSTRKADIKNVKVWYTGANKVFNPSTATQFDSTRTILTDTMTFVGSQNVQVDTNYFWLTYSIKDTAKIGNFIDGELLSQIVNGISSVPSVTNPAGTRKIIEKYCLAAATNAADEDIGKFVLGTFSNGVDTPINNNPLSNKLYSDFTLLDVSIQKQVTTPVSVSLINSLVNVYTTNVNIFIDYNQNGTFDLPQERVYKGTSAANLTARTVSGNIILPITALNGPTRMRVIATETTVTDLPPCGTFTWGEVEDYTINILPPPPGDYYPPDFISKGITPAGGACTAVPHTVTVVVTDTVGVDTVYMNWSINNVPQPIVPMVRTINTNNFTYTIPAQGSSAVEYSFSAVDVSPNRNRSQFAGGTYADEKLKSRLVVSPEGYIGVGGNYQLYAAVSNLVKIGTGTTFTTAAPTPYYTTWWGNKSQYLITAAELASRGFVAGPITSLGLTVGTSTTTLSLTNFTIYMKNSTVTSLTSTFETGLTQVFTTPSYTIVPSTVNAHTFQTPFIWDGTSNVVIETCFNNSAWNGSTQIEYTATTNMSSYSTQDNSTVCSNTGGTVGTGRPNFLLGQPITVNYSWAQSANGGLSATNISNPVATPTGGLGVYQYIVSATDTSCTATDTVLLNVIAPPVVNLGPNRNICNGSTITLDAGNPGDTYLWSTGATTQTIDVTVGATYIVAVTNRANLVARDTIVLTQVAAPNVSLGADTINVCAGSTSTVDAGNAGSTYLWSTGATTQTVQLGTPGMYYVVVTNSNGCTATDSVRVLNYAAPTVSLGADQSICSGAPVTLDAGAGASSYLWSTGATTQTILVGTAGTYVVTVTSSNGCTAKDTINITTKPAPTVSLGADKSKCPADSVTLDAGAGFTSYLWSNGATTQTVRTPNAGTYVVTVTNADGCSAKDTIVVNNFALPVVNLGNDLNICTSDTITLDAGNTGSTYLWSTGATTRTIKVSLAGTYSVNVTSVNGCSSSDAIVVTNKAVPVSTFTVSGANGQSVTFQADGTGGLQYSWNFGDPTSPANTSQLVSPTHVFTAPGKYNVTLTVTNVATNCRATTVTEITVTGVGNDFAEVFKLGAAPNPFIGNTTISYVLPESANNVEVEVFDMIGRKVASLIEGEYQNAGRYTYNYKNEDLQTASGVYMVRLTVDGKVAYIRIIDIAKK